MTYCINPSCPNFNDTSNANERNCANCGPESLLEGRYRVIQPLGRGSFGQTFEVDDVRGFSGGEAPRKVLKVLLTNYPQAVSLFQREARVLSQLEYPGIPRVEPDGYFTFWPQDSQEPVHCLVMEKIEGINLRDWLSNQNNQPITQEQAIAWLKQLAEILTKIHQQQYLHRDIKPSNIMLKPDGQLVLIDFGAVREATETYLQKLEARGGTSIISPGYTPTEQANGRAVRQSDFYAMGRTFVHLLTGKHPLDLSEDPQTGELAWRNSAPQVSQRLADLIAHLMATLSANRPENALIILHRLYEIERPPRKKWLIGGLVVSTIFLPTTAVIYQLITQAAETCPLKVGDHLSCGEEILFRSSAVPEKQNAAQAFAQKDYKSAIRWLESARRKQRNDPETLIYLNNAQLADGRAYTIAVAASTGCNPDTTEEILQGVAQAQNDVNHGTKINGIGLRVLIADDANTPAQGKQIAEALASQSGVLGVVGHCASEVTLSAVEVYKQHQLVMISPTSTSEELSLKGEGNPFILRVVPSDRVAAGALASYLINQARQQKAAIFYNPHGNYSKSLRDQFRISFGGSRGKVVKEFDLSDPFFDAGAAIDEAHKQGATALVLLPDGHTHPQGFENALKVVQANQRRYWMVAGDSFYSSDVLQMVGQEAVNRLVVGIPWYGLNSPDPEFPQAAKNLWGAAVSWRTALAYDATRALIIALKEHPQAKRSLVQKALKLPTFQANGATGVIRFRPNGDQNEPLSQLVKVVKSNCSNSNYEFLPVESSPSETGSLRRQQCHLGQ